MRQGAERRWMPRATRRVAVLVGTVVSVGAVVSVSACTGAAPEPPSTTPVTTSAEATTSPSPTPTAPAEPAKPASWTTGSDDAAVDAAAYFMDLYNYVIATGDLTEWDALSDPGCEFCANTHEDVGTVYSSGGRLEGGRLSVDGATLVDYSTTLHIHEVQFAFVTDPARQVADDDSIVSSTAAESGYVVVTVGFTGDRWNLVSGQAMTEPRAPRIEAGQ